MSGQWRNHDWERKLWSDRWQDLWCWPISDGEYRLLPPRCLQNYDTKVNTYVFNPCYRIQMCKFTLIAECTELPVSQSVNQTTLDFYPLLLVSSWCYTSTTFKSTHFNLDRDLSYVPFQLTYWKIKKNSSNVSLVFEASKLKYFL